MTKTYKLLDEFLHNRLAILSFVLLGSGIGTYWLYLAFTPFGYSPFLMLPMLFLWELLLLFVLVSTYRVFSENKRVLQIAYQLYSINHEYQDALTGVFSVYRSTHSGVGNLTVDELLMAERTVLCSVCQQIAEIFSTMIARKCVVTVKLLGQQENGGGQYCFTWSRSADRIGSDPMQKFTVGCGRNTGFDEALKLRSSAPSFFYGSDLQELHKRGQYENEREGWENVYRSTIVVPIRYVFDAETSDNVGFLCVDTLSSNRLNGTYHVQMLAAFADQMYNFISLMRNRFSINTVNESDPVRSAELGDQK